MPAGKKLREQGKQGEKIRTHLPSLAHIPFQRMKQPCFFRGVVGGMVIGIFILISGMGESIYTSLLGSQPAYAQIVSSSNVWEQVYQQLPDLPRENQYISKETGKVAPNNTLVSRMISYHLYLKGRAPNYRLDWKLTLADYLGANEIMYDSRYPGNGTLRKNPLESDRAAIARLNRRQRDALVQVFVNIFNTNSQNTPVPTPK